MPCRLLQRRGARCPSVLSPLLPAPPRILQHPDLIEKQRRVFSDAIKVYADPQPAAAVGAGGGKGRK